ncbi:MAG: hypothetical protein ACRCZW_09650 [Lactobacillaceae bacterium]
MISWKEFYSLCIFPEEEKREWENFYRSYYISSNQSFIDSYNGCEIDTFKYLKVDYHVLVTLKHKFPNCYIEFLRNYQIQLLIKKEQTPRRSMTYEAFFAIIIAEKVYSGWLSKERGVRLC